MDTVCRNIRLARATHCLVVVTTHEISIARSASPERAMSREPLHTSGPYRVGSSDFRGPLQPRLIHGVHQRLPVASIEGATITRSYR